MGCFYQPEGGWNKTKWWLTFFIRGLQLGAAIAVIVIYGMDLPKGLDAKWLFATIVGIISLLVGIFLVYARTKEHWHHSQTEAHHLKSRWWWEVPIIVLWAAVSGVFGMMYLGKHPKGDADSKIFRMSIGLYIDFANIGLWVMSCLWNWLRYRKSLKRDWEDLKEPGTY